MRRHSPAFALVAIGSLISFEARADDGASRTEANDFFRAAVAAYERHDYSAAALAFEEANRRVPNPSTIYNAARAWDDGADPARAADDYEKAIADPQLDAGSRSAGAARLGDLTRHLGTLTVLAPADALVSVGRVREALPPLVVHLAPGSYDIEVSAPHSPGVHRSWVSVAGQRATVNIEVPRQARMAASQPMSSTPPAAGEASGQAGLVVAGGVTIGLGVVLAATAAGLGVAALSAVHDYNDSNHTDGNARSRTVTLRAFTDVAWITAGTALLVGATLLTVGLASRRDVRIATNGSVLFVTGSF